MELRRPIRARGGKGVWLATEIPRLAQTVGGNMPGHSRLATQICEFSAHELILKCVPELIQPTLGKVPFRTIVPIRRGRSPIINCPKLFCVHAAYSVYKVCVNKMREQRLAPRMPRGRIRCVVLP